MAIFSIHHLTRYTYSEPVRESANQVKLFAIQDQSQRVLSHRLDITHDPVVDIYTDYWGNRTGVFTLTHFHRELKIASSLTVETFPMRMAETEQNPLHHWEQLVTLRSQPLFFDYLNLEQFGCYDHLSGVINSLHYQDKLPLEVIREMSRWIYKEFRYIKGITTIDTTLDEIWSLRAGVCQDFAHLLLAMLRMIDVPARYVSGYICPNRNGMRGEGATHAWVEAFLPFHGWTGIDPTNNCLVTDGHVRLAVGRHFADVTPVKGFFKGDAEQVMEVAVSVSYDPGTVASESFGPQDMQVAGAPERRHSRPVAAQQ